MAEGGPQWEKIIAGVVVAFVSYILLSSLLAWRSTPTAETLLADVPVNPILKEHSKVFHEKQVVKVKVFTEFFNF